jgi:hypothetical protein
MIARMWQARTTGPQRVAEYHQVFEAEVLESLRGVGGFRGAYLFARPAHELMEIRTVTLFASLEAVKGFAGPGYEHERVTPAARATLFDSDPSPRHFDVLTAL